MIVVNAALRPKEVLICDLVHATVTERIAPQHPPCGENCSAKYAQLFNRLNCVAGAARLVLAARGK